MQGNKGPHIPVDESARLVEWMLDIMLAVPLGADTLNDWLGLHRLSDKYEIPHVRLAVQSKARLKGFSDPMLALRYASQVDDLALFMSSITTGSKTLKSIATWTAEDFKSLGIKYQAALLRVGLWTSHSTNETADTYVLRSWGEIVPLFERAYKQVYAVSHIGKHTGGALTLGATRLNNHSKPECNLRRPSVPVTV
jgi:hypothetical protein